LAERLSLIAGSGALVSEVIEAARGHGYDLQVLSISRSVRGVDSIPMKLSDPQGLVGAIKGFGSTIVAMAGGLPLSDLARERFSRFLGVPGAASLGDGGLSGLAGKLTEMTGARLVGVHEIVPDLLAPHGLIGGPQPSDDLREDARFALGVALRAGALDLGQAVVVAGRRVISAEDITGTDALLKRVQTYRAFGLVGDGSSALILAKAAKPSQPHFVDLPAIGPVTVAKAKRAGVQLIVVQAGATILIERQKLAAAADAAKLTILGLAADG
jgi:UDP-2,3-diacylglucosamine hydrolase